MISTQDEEIESLQAIFCKNGEFTFKKEADGLHLTVIFNFSSMVSGRMTRHGFDESCDSVNFVLAPGYPLEQPPRISITSSYLPADIVATIKQQVEGRAAALLGQSMLLDLCHFIQELLEKELQARIHDVKDSISQSEQIVTINKRDLQEQAASTNISLATDRLQECRIGMTITNPHRINDKCDMNFTKVECDSKFVTAILHLDHMRSQQNYIKFIKKWTMELSLNGWLILCRKLILILLQGRSRSVKEYIVRNRTMNVDVDVRGRACKERMLTVLCEVPAETHLRLSEFCVLQLPTTESLQEFFHTCAMEDLYTDYVNHLVCTFTKK